MNPGVRYSQSNEKVISAIISSPGNEVVADIRSFEFLPHGWDFGAGDPIKRDIVRKALDIHDIGLKLGLLTEATPEVDGSITLTFVYGEDAVDIRIHPDFTYTVTHERGIGVKFERLTRKRRVALPIALQYLYNLRPQFKTEYTICASCESSGLERSVRESGDGLRPTVVLPTILITYPSSNWYASTHALLKYAHT